MSAQSKTVEPEGKSTTLSLVLEAITKGAEPNVLATLLASELDEQRKEIATLRLLLEHEERVRSEKLKPVMPIKKQSFLRSNRIYVGDRVTCSIANGHEGTVMKIDSKRANRVGVHLDGCVDNEIRWFKTSDLLRTIAVA